MFFIYVFYFIYSLVTRFTELRLGMIQQVMIKDYSGKYKVFVNILSMSVSHNNNNIYLKSNVQCIYAYEFSGLYTIWLYNLKQYGHNQILNELVILHYCIL